MRSRNRIPFERKHQSRSINEVPVGLEATFYKIMRPLLEKYIHKDETRWLFVPKLPHVTKELRNREIVVLRKYVEKDGFWEDDQIPLHDGQNILVPTKNNAAPLYATNQIRAKPDAKAQVVLTSDGKLCVIVPW